MTKDTSTTRHELMVFVLRLVELLRPHFYNRITWLVVLSGIGMMSTKLWELVANALLEKELNLSISGGNDAAWGFALCVLGLLYHMANTGFYELLTNNEARARRQLEIEHDKGLFNTANEILNQERLESFIEVLENDHSFYMDESGRIDEFARFLAMTSNHFLTPLLAEATNNMLLAWRELGHFLSYKFSIFPKNQVNSPYRLCMAPSLNMDREGNGSADQVGRYDELTAKLETLASKLVAAYRDFRRLVKSELVI